MVHVLKEIERLRNHAILTNELHAVFFWVFGLSEFVHQTQSLEWEITKGNQ